MHPFKPVIPSVASASIPIHVLNSNSCWSSSHEAKQAPIFFLYVDLTFTQKKNLSWKKYHYLTLLGLSSANM